MPHFTCKLDAPGTPLRPVWNHTVGSGRAALALRADWQRQLARARRELGVRHVRFHGILCDEMGTFLIEKDKPVYSFFNTDQIFDFLLGIGMRPFVELSFMPRALATSSTTVFSYAANVSPPNNWRKWAALIRKLVEHWIDRYGIVEVRQWYFEVWNEPNLSAFWTGNQADYFKLYQYTVKAIKDIDDALRVGGPATADDEWIEDFIEFCAKKKLPVDFISTHHYPTDALGKPGDDTLTELSKAPRNVLQERTQQTCRAAAGLPVCYTEWNSSSNPFFHLHDQPYAAAFLMKNMLDVANLVEAYSWWTFSDIFEENYFSSIPFHGGFGMQTINGIAKPTWRAMQLLNGAVGERLPVDGLHRTVDSWAIRKDPDELLLLLANHAFPEHPIKTESVTFTLRDSRKPIGITLERVDEQHANPRALWKKMDSPEYLSAHQLQRLHEASQIGSEPAKATAHDDGVDVEFKIPPHGIAAVRVHYRPRRH